MSNIEALCRDWRDAKNAENAARDVRVSIEKELAAALDVPPEGSKTHKLDNFKVTLTQPVTRKVDARKWATVMDRVPRALRPVKTTLAADSTGCKWLANNEPEMWAAIAEAFEVKPGKVGVKVEEV